MFVIARSAERDAAIHLKSTGFELDCFVELLLAMTEWTRRPPSPFCDFSCLLVANPAVPVSALCYLRGLL